MIGELISAGANLLGGYFNRQSNEHAQRLTLEDKEKDRALQREFAQSGIQWRTADARAAGIHPLAALGGSGSSYTPSAISIAPDTSMGTAVSGMGQDISRAINSTRTNAQREDAYTKTVKELTLQKAGLENDLLRTQLASSVQRLKQTANPPMPSPGEHERVPLPMGKQEDRKPLMLGGERWPTQEGNSNAQDYEDRYGEISDWTFGPAILWNDYMGHTEPFMGQVQSRRFRENLGKWLPKFLKPR